MAAYPDSNAPYNDDYDGYDDYDDRQRDYYDTDREDTSDSSGSSFVRVRRRLTRAERYRRPKNVTEVVIQNIAGDSNFHARAPERENTGHRLDKLTQIRQRHHFGSIEWRKILSIRRYVNEDGRETALVQSQMSTMGGGKDGFEFEWIHLKAKHPRLHDFQNFVAALTSVDLDERSLATILLKKAVKEYERSYSSGKFLEPSVDRCDAHNESGPDKWAILLSIHHLHAAPRARNHSADADSHHPRTLFEYRYVGQENTVELDDKQLLRQASQSDEILHVHNMWLLLLSSGTLITVSPDSLEDCLGPAVIIEDITNQSTKGGFQIIRFLDPTGQQFFVPSAQCETWFAMMDKVVGLCGSTYGNDTQRYHINDVDGVEITASEWQRFFTSQDSFCATVRISLFSTTPPEVPQLSAAARRSSSTSSLRNDRQDLIHRRRDDESPSYRRSGRRAHRDNSRSREVIVVKSRRRTEERAVKEARIEQMNQEIEREVASVLHPDHDSAAIPSTDVPENAATSTSSMQTTTGGGEYQGILSPYRTDSPAPLDTENKPRTQRSRSPLQRRSTRRTTADSSAAVARRSTRPSTHVNGPRGPQRKNELALVLYGTGGASRVREPGTTITRKSTGAVPSPSALAPAVDADRDRDQLVIVRRDTRSSEERERSIKRRREKPMYRVDNVPSIITNEQLHVKKFDHIFYLPKDVFNTAKGYPALNEGSGSKAVPGKDPEARTTAASTFATTPSVQAPEFSSSDSTKTDAKVTADIQQPPKPRWKKGEDQKLPQENLPPPVFLWQTGNNVNTVPEVPPPTEGASVPNKNNAVTQEPQNWQVLNLILDQIHLSLTRGDRISGDAVQRVQEKEKEAAIYKHLQESSLEAIQATYTQLSPQKPADPDPASSDITGRIVLCLEILRANGILPSLRIPVHSSSEVLGWRRSLVGEQMMSAESGQGSRYFRRGGRSEFPLDAFYVVDAEMAPRKAQDPALQNPVRLPQDCSDCTHRRAYHDMDAIVLHLHQVHFQHLQVTDEQLRPWIRKGDKVDGFQLHCDAKRLVDTVFDHCTHLRVLKDEVIAGVCGSGKFDSAIYRLPNGLVRAFERILTMMAYSGYVASLSVREYDESPERFRRFFNLTYQNHIVELGYAAEGAFDEAKSNLMLMSRVNEYSNSIQFDTVGPEYMVLLLLSGLHDRGSRRNSLCLPALHGKELDRLIFEVRHHPRRRLLQELLLLETEVNAVGYIRGDCQRIVEDYAGLLASSGFKKTTTTRRRLYRDFERDLSSRILKDIQQDEREARILLEKIPDLCGELTQAVEIQQEDHGKAILVFTIVTIVFLPMSFVTGFLGMNTVDMRNLESGQWVFWAAAIPLTFVVVGVTIWIGYKGEALSRWLWLRQARANNTSRRHLTSSASSTSLPPSSSNMVQSKRQLPIEYNSGNGKVNQTTDRNTSKGDGYFDV